MKLGFLTLNTSSFRGGSEKLWRGLAKKAAVQNHDVVVSVFHSEFMATAKFFKNSNVKVCSRPSFTGNSIQGKIIGRIQEKLIGWRYNQFFTGKELDAYVISCGGLAELGVRRNQIQIKNLSKPYVIIIQNNTENWVFEKRNLNMVGDLVKGAVKVFFVSYRIQEQAERQLGIKFHNASLVANPILKSKATQLPKSDIVKAAFIGTADLRVKGMGLLIQAMAHKDWAERKLLINVYGEGIHEEEIKMLIEKFGVADKFKIHGWVDDIEQIWNHNSTLISTSFNEGLPLVIQEAMMRGRVVVATDVGGPAEIITDGENGYIAEAASLSYVLNALERWWNDRDNWEAVGEKAASRIREFHEIIPKGEAVLDALITQND
jgi:glycosyltransferase involved in cell wall biosynthesis